MQHSPKYCSSCGRMIGKALYFAEEPDKPLCSFCMDSKRRIWKAQKENIERGYKLHYCFGCGARISKNIAYINGNLCSECYTKKVQSDAVRNKLHEEALQHE